MSSSLDRLLTVGTDGPAVEVRRARKSHPPGWVPGVTITGSGGMVVTEPRETAPEDWDALLVELLPPGMDAAKYAVDGDTVEVRAWDSGDGEGGTRRQYYFKARVRLRETLTDAIPLDDIIDAAKKARTPKPAATGDEERVYFFQVTDLQAGQADGDGVEGLVARSLELSSLALDDLRALKKAGTPATGVLIPITGDLVEGISGWYETQTFSVELDRRDQVKLVRRILTEFILSIASYGLPVHVAVVPGNHGENRQNGKTYTSFGDNDDVAVVEQIAEAFALAGITYVTFSFPERDRLSLTIEVLGHVVALTHGHVGKAGAGTEGKILNWFKSMAATRDPVGDADLLITGHYHHPRFQNLIGDTYWVQGGALCDASSWFSQSFGLVSDPMVMKGTITRAQVIERLLPHSWGRSRVTSKVVE